MSYLSTEKINKLLQIRLQTYVYTSKSDFKMKYVLFLFNKQNDKIAVYLTGKRNKQIAVLSCDGVCIYSEQKKW